MAKSFWRTLGIKKTIDVAEIKRAYAAKLKLTRPDENPEGFQALRQARESAENWARDQKRRLSNKEVGFSDEENERADIENEETLRKIDCLREQVDEEPQNESDELEEFEQPNKNQPYDVLADWLEGMLPEPDQLEIFVIFRRIRELGFEERENAEQRLLQAIRTNFEWRDNPQLSAEHKHSPPVDDSADETILKICDEFGWFNNDRRFAELLYWDYERVSDQLRSLRDYGGISKSAHYGSIETKPAWRLPGLWVWLAIVITLQALRFCSNDNQRTTPVLQEPEQKPLIRV
jgi:hypothetical protein